MKLKRILISIVVLLVLAGAIAAFVKTRGQASGGGDESSDENIPSIISVQVGALTNVTLHRYIGGYGMIEAAPATAKEASAGAALAASTAGIVSGVNVTEGQRVKKGDVLMELDSSTATFDYAKAELQRQRKLFAQQNTSLKNVEDAAAQLASLEVVAPVSGTVVRVNVRPGQAVDTTTSLVEIINLDRLAIAIKVPLAQAGQMQEGQDIQITSEPPLTARLSFVSSIVDPADGAVPGWALLPRHSGLRPGQFVSFKLVTETRTNCLVAPAESVVTDENGESAIWLVNGEQATKTSVRTGLRNEDWVEVKAAGLRPGDLVVTVGAYGLPDKTQIKILSPLNSATRLPAGQ